MNYSYIRPTIQYIQTGLVAFLLEPYGLLKWVSVVPGKCVLDMALIWFEEIIQSKSA